MIKPYKIYYYLYIIVYIYVLKKSIYLQIIFSKKQNIGILK